MSRIASPALALLAGALLAHAAPAAAVGIGVTIASGDINRDGFEDVVALEPDTSRLDLLMADGQGGFSLTTQDYPDIGAMSSVALADVDGDGWLDVIISDQADGAAGVRVLHNQQDGSFAADVSYPTRTDAGPGPVSVTAADVNGDGFQDLITANGASGTLSVLINDGDGTFAAPVVYDAGTQPTSVTVADMNGDSFPDLVVTDTAGDSVLILLNDGSGGFAAPLVQPVGAGPVAVSVTDVDGDGHADVLVANRDDNTAGVLLGLGDGSFVAPVFYPTGDQPGWIAAEDLDGDGRPDLVTDNYRDGSISLFPNQGSGGFGDPQQLFPDYGSYDTVVMDVGGKPALVSANVPAGVVVTTPGAAAVKGGSGGKPPKSTVHQIGGAHDPQSSTGGGMLDLFSLVLLAALGLFRRR